MEHAHPRHRRLRRDRGLRLGRAVRPDRRLRRRRRLRRPQRRLRHGRHQSRLRGDGADSPAWSYLCSLQVARKTYSLDSYRLPLAAAAAGFTGFSHHDALADAEACAAIVAHAALVHGADDLGELAAVAAVKVKVLKPVVLPEDDLPAEAAAPAKRRLRVFFR
nr:hypothetical protein GCM10025699_60900 [Microbacterium flavescens]